MAHSKLRKEVELQLGMIKPVTVLTKLTSDMPISISKAALRVYLKIS